jgi:cytochrome c oxidase subunit 2
MFGVQNAFAKSFMPVQGSTFAPKVDSLYEFLVVASLISCVLVIGGMVYFAYKYRRRSESDKTPYISHNAALEFLWSFIPFVIFMVVFTWGWIIYHDMRSMPKNAFEIHVGAQKWAWDFTYKSGRKTANEFYVPLGEPVKLIMQSRDVIHSFYIPGFRVKQDVLPGRYTALWFEATKPGSYQVFCTEFCGDKHSAMLAKLHVLPRPEFEEWLKNDPYKGLSLAEVGKKIVTQGQCVACHQVSDQRGVGPGFKGLFGSTKKFADGSSLVADENYIRESVLNPNAKVVEGFAPGVMPVFQGQLSDQEVSGIIEYIKSLN